MEKKKELEVQLELDKVLGRGRYGFVFKGLLKGIEVAVKRIQLVDFENQREQIALQRFEHPNVIRLIHVEEDEHFRLNYLHLNYIKSF